ncbi:MAG: hypothetical protein P8Y48_16725 [Novosphingobium sp.]
MESQFYKEGVFNQQDDEALIIESDVPESCRYRSLILTNALYETTDWTNNHAGLNGAQAALDRDGKLCGIMLGRWIGGSSHLIPKLTKVKFRGVLKSLPVDVAKVTPEQRDDIVRERNRAYQQRALG